MYQKYLDADLEENIPREEDPFWEPPEPVLIGTANAYLQVRSLKKTTLQSSNKCFNMNFITWVGSSYCDSPM